MQALTSDQIRQDCWNKSIHCLATSYIFQRKAKKYGDYLRYNSILGLIIPILIGSIAATYGASSPSLKWILIIAAPFSILQAIISGLALANKWEGNLSYSLESQTANRELSDKFKELAKYSANDINELQKKSELLFTIDNERTRQDEKVHFSDKENRKGMRYALMILQINCIICGIIPQRMNSTECTNCGKF